MNWLKRLFKRKITGGELNELLLSLGKNKKFIYELNEHIRQGYTQPFAYLDVKKKSDHGVEFDLEIYKKYFYDGPIEEDGSFKGGETVYSGTLETRFRKGIPYRDLTKNPDLKKYVKKRNLESSLAVFSIASVLASAFFLAGNITGNAILANNANSSGLIGAGLFVLGLVSWILARNI